MKQTAVEWLIDQMFKQGYFDGNKPLTYTNLDHLQQQAKEMEKEQMHSEYMRGWKDGLIKQGPPPPPLDRKIWR
jgi:hypothetical protein